MADHIRIGTVPGRPGDQGVYVLRDFDAGEWLMREEQLIEIPLTSSQDPDQYLEDLARVVPAIGGHAISNNDLRRSTTRQKKVKDWVSNLATSPDAAIRAKHTNFMNLKGSNASPDGEIDRFLTNNFTFHPKMGVVFRVFNRISRINHSCRNNAVLSWDEQRKEGFVRAVKPIEAGEEITLCYLPDSSLQNASLRKQSLHQLYNFQCNCAACNTNNRDFQLTEARRNRLGYLYDELDVGNALYNNGAGCVVTAPGRPHELASEYCHLLQEEGIVDYRLAVGYLRWSQVTTRPELQFYGQFTEADGHFNEAMRICKTCLGQRSDHLLMLDMYKR